MNDAESKFKSLQEYKLWITNDPMKDKMSGPARCKHSNLARGPRPWCGVNYGPPNNATCPLGDYETQR